MVRKGNSNHKSEQYHRTESSGRVCKTPRVVLERLNIPLDSVVLVRGDSIIYPVESSSNNNSSGVSNVIDITLSDEDTIEDVAFQEKVVKRFQSTKGNSDYNQSGPVSSSKKHSELNYVDSPTPKYSTKQKKLSSRPSKGGKQKKIFSKSKILNKKFLQLHNSSRSKKTTTQKKQIEMREANKELIETETTVKHIEMKVESSALKSKVKKDAINVEKQSILGVSSNTEEVIVNNYNKNSVNACVDTDKFVNNQDQSSVNEVSEKSTELEGTSTVMEKSEVTEQLNHDQRSTVLLNPFSQENDETTADITPSRTSQRIKNKKVKFSALRLLAGGDIYSLKRDLNLDEEKSPPNKSAIITKASNTADINASNSNLSSSVTEKILDIDVSPKQNDKSSPAIKHDRFQTSEGKKDDATPKTVKNTTSSKRKLNLNVTKEEGSKEGSLDYSPQIAETINKEKDNSCEDISNLSCGNQISDVDNNLNCSTDTVQKSTVKEKNGNIMKVSSKIRLTLKGAPKRKVVSISANPSKDSQKSQEMRQDNLKPVLDVELGPDIIIRRVKSGKRQLSDQTNVLKKSGEKQDVPVAKDTQRTHGASVTEDTSITKDATVTNGNVQEPTAAATATSTSVIPKNLVVKNLVYPEKSVRRGILPLKEVEVPPQIKKLIIDAAKNRKPITFKPSESLMTKINALASNNNSADESESPFIANSTKKKKKLGYLNRRGAKSAVNKEKLYPKGKIGVSKNKEANIDLTFEKDKYSDEADSDREFQDADSTVPDSETQLFSSALGEEDVAEKSIKKTPKIVLKGNTLQSKDMGEMNIAKVGGKKTAKVTPLRQVNRVQPRSEVIKKSSNEKLKVNEKEVPKFQKSKTVPKLRSPSELCILGSKRNYRNAFEKYFISTEKVCECSNESMDSDGSEETILLSHFINLNKRGSKNNEEMDAAGKEDIVEEVVPLSRIEDSDKGPDKVVAKEDVASRINEEKSESSVGRKKVEINEILKDVTANLPKWNYHVIPDSSVICLILLEREASGTLDVKKCIEIDCNYKATVYVNKVLVDEYCGIYDSSDAIRNLIYQIDLL